MRERSVEASTSRASAKPVASGDVYERARDAAVDAAKRAAALIRLHAGRVATDEVREKGVHDLVTHVDEEAQRIIIDALREAFPDFGVLAEEGADDDRLSPVADGHRWIVDPIDGTTNFTHGVPPYAVSIALQRDATLVLGVVLDVARDELFTAVRGRGLYVNGARAWVRRAERLDESLLATGFPYRRYAHIDRYLGVLKRFLLTARGVRRHGVASIDLAYVACGRFDGFFETGLRPWDVAAGTVLVEEAGGRVSDYRGGGDPVFDRQIVASNGRIHDAMLDVLGDMADVRL
jgi:myo-inositol-1(or 4)-monophosphatase